jgi:hypothetical protein
VSDFQVRDRRKPGHFWADNEVLDVFSEQLRAQGFAVYMMLTRRANNDTGECQISVRVMAKQMGMSVGAVFSALKVICDLGLARKVFAGDNRNPAIYELADVKACVHLMNADLNAAFTLRTPNKEKKDFYNTKPPIAPLSGICAEHPESGLTPWGTCWACYSGKYSGVSA